MSNFSSGILGLGIYLPKKILTNYDLEKMIETTDEWIFQRTGIKERRIMDPNEQVSDLGTYAAKEAIKDAGIKKEEIDFIISCSSTPELIWPATACLIQSKLKIKNQCPALDIQAVCSGFSFGLAQADLLIRAGQAHYLLLVAAEAPSRYLNWQDRKTCILFGDGAGAVVLGRVEEGDGLTANYLGSSGDYAHLLEVQGGGSSLPGWQVAENKDFYIQMNGREVFKLATQIAQKAAKEVLRNSSKTLKDVDWFLPHQANQRITNQVAKKLGFPKDKVISNIEKYGNTLTASIPLALYEIYKNNKLKRRDLILIVSFGAGMTWGANLIVWNKEKI